MKSYLAPLFSLFLYSNILADTKEISLPFVVNGNPYVGSIKLTEDSTSSIIYIDASNGQNKLSAKLVDYLNDGTVDSIEQNHKTTGKSAKSSHESFLRSQMNSEEFICREIKMKRTRMQMPQEERTGTDEWFKRLKDYVNNGLPLSIFEYNVDE